MGGDKANDSERRRGMNPVMRISFLQNANHYVDQPGNDLQPYFSMTAYSHTEAGFFFDDGALNSVATR